MAEQEQRFTRRTTVHTNSSQLVSGEIFATDVTQAEVERMVKGTFGGRFKYFKAATFGENGSYSYVAYTD